MTFKVYDPLLDEWQPPAVLVNPTDPVTRLKRRWVGVLDEHGLDMVKRRSVILQAGWNHLKLRWDHASAGLPSIAALYQHLADHEPFLTAAMRCEDFPSPSKIACGDIIRLTWNVVLND